MSRKSSVEILSAAGIEVIPVTSFTVGPTGKAPVYSFSASAIPPQIINRIKQEPLLDRVDVTGKRPFGGQILRTKSMIFNPKGEFFWSLPDVSNLGGFVAIAVDELTLKAPSQLSDIAKLILVAPYLGVAPKGADGVTGAQGWMSGRDDGANGREGNPGGTGGTGESYDYPSVFIFVGKVVVNIANPSITSAMKIEGNGIKGGDGGRGGQGGQGGHGMRGTPGDRDCSFLGICTCSAGPGDGGSGGPGGPGGRGGDAGRGGNGASIFLVGKATEHQQLTQVEILNLGEVAGQPGGPGLPGQGGGAGGGGSKPWECTGGGGSGSQGGAANPTDLGFGNPRFDGMDGTVFTPVRDNSDLF